MGAKGNDNTNDNAIVDAIVDKLADGDTETANVLGVGASKAPETVAYGVTQSFVGKARQPRYHTIAIREDGSIFVMHETYVSWQDATKAAKALVAKDSGTLYWIADQYKAFQRRVARERDA